MNGEIILNLTPEIAGVEAPAIVLNVQAGIGDFGTSASLAAHVADTANPHATTKTQVGLGNVDNTSDANKPVSTAQQTALDLKAPLASPTFTGTVSGVTKAMVDLGNVDNTSDANKPVSTAQQAALDLKAPIASPTFTGTVSGVTKAMVGLGNVDNTSDANKPVSTAQQAALDLKMNLTYLDTDVTLANNSDVRVSTQRAVKSYVDALLGAQNAFKLMGSIDASANPNYPAASAAEVYIISVAGKIGGASGPDVEAGDIITCSVDNTAAGTHAAVGSNWVITQGNIVGAVTTGGGGNMTVPLGIFAGTAALPGLAVAGDLNTGIYGVSADVLGVAAGGSVVQTWGVGTSTLTGSLTATGNLSVGIAGAHSTDYGITINNGSFSGSNAFISFKNGAAVTELARIDMNQDGLLNIGTVNAAAFEIKTSNVNRWQWSSAGHYLPAADNTYDLGAAATQVRDGFFSRKLRVGGAVLGANGLDVYTASAGTIASFQSNALAPNGQAFTINIGNAITGSATGFYMAGDLTGNWINNVQNSNTGAGGAKYLALVLGTGDPFMTFEVNGATTWSHGLDNSDSDSYKISQGSSLGTNDRLTILTGGDTGIGVTAPNRKLSVNGSIGFAETNGNSVWHMTSISGELFFTKSGSFDAWSMTSAGIFKPGADNTYDLATTASRVRSGYFGTNVVIGNTSTSTAQLHVGAGIPLAYANGAGVGTTSQLVNSQASGSAALTAGVGNGVNNRRAALFVDQDNAVWGLSALATSGLIPFIISNNGAEQLRLDTSGRLGIGENNPSYLLDAKATSSGATVAGLRLNNSGTGANTRVSLNFQAAGAVYNQIVGGYGAASPEMQFNQLVGSTGIWTWNSSGTEVMRLTGAGRIGLGVTSPLATFHVRTPTTEYEAARFDATDTAVFTSWAIAGTRFGYIGSASQITDGGTTTALAIRSDNILWFASGGSTRRWQIDASGHYLAGADATYNIGASGANRPNNIYAAGSITSGSTIAYITGSYNTQLANGGFYATVPSGANAYLRLVQTGIVDFSISNVASTGVIAYSGATTHEFRNGTNAQAFRVYNTYTDASNYERGFIRWAGNEFYIGTEKDGTGTARILGFQTDGVTRWYMSTGGHFYAVADNTYDIGGSTSSRVRNLYVASGVYTTNLNLTNGAGTIIYGGLTGTGDGVFRLLNAAGTDFSRLQLGGTTSAFPSIKRVSAGIHFVLADDTGFATVQTGNLTANGAIAATGSIAAGATNGLSWSGRTILRSPADGQLRLLDSAESISATLAVEAANILAMRNGTNTNAFRIYNTYTDASNYERGVLDWTSNGNSLTIGTAKAGTGANRSVTVQIGGTNAWFWTSSGHFHAWADNTYDIGASGANRPRTIYTGTSFVAPDGSDASPSFTFGTTQTGMYRDAGGGRIRFAIGGTFGVSISSGGIGIASDTALLQLGSFSDVVLTRDAAGVLASRNGTTAQLFRIYNTWTDASNYERGTFSWISNDLKFGIENAGTGSSSRQLHIHGGAQLRFYVSGNLAWVFDNTGHFRPAADNTYDLGLTANRVRTGYFRTSVQTGGLLVGYTAKTAAYTATAADSVIATDATTASFAITLPTAVGVAGQQYTIKKTTAANLVTVNTTSSQTIDGVTSRVLTSKWDMLQVVSDGANWIITEYILKTKKIVSTVANVTTTWAWNSDDADAFEITAQAGNLTISADAGNPANMQSLLMRIKDDGTSRTLSFTTGSSKSFRAVGSGVTLPTTTVAGKTLVLSGLYNSTAARWDIMAVGQEQ